MTFTYAQTNLLATLRVLLNGNEPALFQLELLQETMEKDINKIGELAGEAAGFQLLCDELVAESNELQKQLEHAEALLADYRGRLVEQSETITDLKTKMKKEKEKHNAAMAQMRGLKKDLGVKDPTRGEPAKKPAKKRGRPVGSKNTPRTKPEQTEGGAK